MFTCSDIKWAKAKKKKMCNESKNNFQNFFDISCYDDECWS